MIRCNASRRGKITADVNTIAADRDGVHAAIYSDADAADQRRPVGSVPARDVIRRKTARPGKIASDIQLARRTKRRGINHPVYSAAQSRPVIAVPLGDKTRVRSSRRGEIPAGIQLALSRQRDGVDISEAGATHSRVEGHPLTAIPAGNSSNAATIADTAEITSGINVRAVHNDRLDRAGCSAAEGQPLVPIPLGQVIDARAPGPADITAGVHFAAVA